jgi:RimJ/RimL family protein N-acetyltransferase
MSNVRQKTMSRFESITIREVESSDLETFYEHLEVTYWLGREFWGRGLATQALNRMLHLVVDRPILARAATDNIGSIRVLQKCGFKIIGKNKDFANGRGEDTEEYILRLDLDQANE